MMVAYCNHQVLLEHRPDSGIWGGLWSLPEFEIANAPELVCQKLNLQPRQVQALAPFLHVFTHYRLIIHPFLAQALPSKDHQSKRSPARRWVSMTELKTLGLPAPVRKLLEGLQTDQLLK